MAGIPVGSAYHVYKEAVGNGVIPKISNLKDRELGCKPVLESAIEEQLAKFAITMADFGKPLSRAQLGAVVMDYVKHHPVLKDTLWKKNQFQPGYWWIRGFRRR